MALVSSSIILSSLFIETNGVIMVCGLFLSFIKSSRIFCAVFLLCHGKMLFAVQCLNVLVSSLYKTGNRGKCVELFSQHRTVHLAQRAPALPVCVSRTTQGESVLMAVNHNPNQVSEEPIQFQ